MTPGANVSVGSSDNSRLFRAEYNAEMREAFIPLMVIITIESLIGIIGNCLVFYVFSRRYKKCNFKYFALFLCGTDLAGCLTSMPLDIVLRYYYFDVPGRVFCKVKFFFLLSILLAETFLLLIISIDRYRKICHPLSWQMSNRTAVVLVVVSMLVAVVGASLITGIITGRNYEHVTYMNHTITVTQCGSDQKYKETSVSSISIVFEFIVIISILIVMAVLYVLVARQLYKTKVSMDTNKNSDKTQTKFIKSNIAPARRKSIIAISVTVVFIITITIHSVFIFLIASQNLQDLSKDQWAIYSLLYTTYMVNYCINPIIYGCLDHQFSKFLRDIKNRVMGSREEYHTGNNEKAGSSTILDGVD